MKTKREMLKYFIDNKGCGNTACSDCPYANNKCSFTTLKDNLSRIGAMAILRMFPEKPTLDIGTKIRFNSGDIATIKKVICQNVHYYNLVFGNGHRESFDYLIGKTWEVVE